MQSKVMIKPNGLVFWSLPIKLRSSCKIDVTYFPFDDQMCVWKFGSWTYSGLQVDLISSKESGELTNYVVSGEWHLRSITAKRNVQYCNYLISFYFYNFNFVPCFYLKTHVALMSLILT